MCVCYESPFHFGWGSGSELGFGKDVSSELEDEIESFWTEAQLPQRMDVLSMQCKSTMLYNTISLLVWYIQVHCSVVWLRAHAGIRVLVSNEFSS